MDVFLERTSAVIIAVYRLNLKKRRRTLYSHFHRNTILSPIFTLLHYTCFVNFGIFSCALIVFLLDTHIVFYKKSPLNSGDLRILKDRKR